MRILGNARLLRVAVVAAGVVAFASSDALARSRGSWGSYGSSGSYASYGSSGSYGSYGSSGSYASYSSYGSSGSYASSGSYGSRPGLFARWHARKAARKSYGSYGSSGSYASYGSYGSHGGYAYTVSYSSHGSSGSYGSSYYTPVESDGGYVEPSMSEPAPPEAPAAPDAPSAAKTDATIWVSVPEDAKIFVNDAATASTGAERHFISRGLRRDVTYAYQLRVEFQRDGQPVVEDKLVRLRAGDTVNLAFGGAEVPAISETAQTEVKLHVPAEAKVTLAGAETAQTGELRTFATSGLRPGQQWKDYTVRVELERDGQTLVEERVIDVVGGKSYELTVDFAGETAKVASLN